MKSQWLWRFLASLLIGVGLLWLTLQGMADEVGGSAGITGLWRSTVASAQAVEARYLWVYVASFVVVHAARVGRWVVMVRGISDVPAGEVLHVGLVGFAAIVLFPLRLGEFVRPLLLQRRAGVPFSAGLGTAVVERVADGLIITLVLFLSILAAPVAASEVVRSAGWVSLLVFVSATVGLTLFAWKRWLAERIVSETVGRLAPGFSRSLIGMMETFSVGVQSLYGGGRLGWFLLLTAVYWSANAFGMWWLARGFGFMLPWYAGWGLLGTLVVGLMIPTGPGFLGNFQYFVQEGLRLYLPGSSVGAAGLAMGLIQNGLQLVVQVLAAVPAVGTMMAEARSKRAAGADPLG
ncbi:MAG: flippase-like domain-containing protein [Deltaproteobacteria bacterium]|nr:flippase-like domain-containing protein [Deltaproteobacteria bacterium]